MERRKAHVQAQWQTLNKECEITNNLLSKLQQMCSNHVNQIDNKNFQLTSKHLVAILKFQSESIEKLMEWNIGLEKFLAEIGPDDLPHYTLMNGANNLISSPYQNSLPVTFLSGKPAVTETEGIVDLYKRYFGFKVNPNIHESTINSDKVQNYKKNKSYASDSGSAYVPYITETESKLVLNEKVANIKSDPKKDDGGNISLDKDIEKKPIEKGVHTELKEINESFDASSSIYKVLVQNDTHNESTSSFNNSYYTSSSESNLVEKNHPSYSYIEQNLRAKKHFYKEIPERRAPKIGDICTIGFVQSPSEIYIKVIDTNNSFDVLSMQLFREYQIAPIIYPFNKIAARGYGNFWIHHFKNLTCRVEVIDWILNVKTDAVIVQMIDYGCKSLVNYTYLRVLNPNLRNIPRMIHMCHFGYLYPPGSTIEERKQTWPQEVNNKFYEILGKLDETYYRIVRVCYSKQRKSYDIDLIKTDEEDTDSTIGQLLIDFDVAVEIFEDNSDSSDKKELDKKIEP